MKDDNLCLDVGDLGRSPQGERGLKGYHAHGQQGFPLSLPARGARIERGGCRPSSPARRCRSPQGERGLKELSQCFQTGFKGGRSPQGERGLKVAKKLAAKRVSCRSPQGERGLKGYWHEDSGWKTGSLPARGARIESLIYDEDIARRSRSPQGERGLK